jgi:S-adenosylmethionine synthetase
VTPKHPDKICDRISDAILDECLRQDPNGRAAIETMGGHGIITVTGELTTNAWINIPEIAKKIVGDEYKYGVQTNITQQSPKIAQGVDAGGAGDQGIMVGYACSDNKQMMPNEMFLAKSLCKEIFKAFPVDGKTQVTIDDDVITHIVASFQYATAFQLKLIIDSWIEDYNCSKDTVILCNPAGRWNLGGFEADTGLTGRKLIVDNYGPRVPIGGGAFSGKDATKVDRSAAYMARYIAIDLLNKELAKSDKRKEVIVKLAYAIGISEPIQAYAVIKESQSIGLINTHQVNLIDKYDLSPKAIINNLNLRQPIYEQTAEWGAFGNSELSLPWEIIKG